ncbi:MAG TPA: fumarylacetoacetate hydrolase family protein [Anaerolineae bacterium]|nr:fumarylacetoacetate hydrolase family protein [Anaerolineae bacterium]
MRLIRYQIEQEAPQFGWILEDKVGPLSASPVGEYRRLDVEHELQAVKLLAPILPGKIIALGRNYPLHAKEHGQEIPEVPILFFKPPSSVIGPEQAILLPPQSRQVEHEAELAVIIGKRGRWIPAEKARHHILGYTIANDVTARDLQHRDQQWARAKGFDTFCPIGPWIETELNPADVLISCRVNEELRQMSSTREMVFSIPQLIAFISSIMTLEPGDMILTGTPAGVGPLLDGDMVEIEIEGIGTLRNSVIEEKAGKS